MRTSIQDIEAELRRNGEPAPKSDLPHVDDLLPSTIRPTLDITQRHSLSLRCHALLHAAWAEALSHKYGVRHAMLPTEQDIAVRQQIEMLLENLRPREDKE
jgi:hypothetical protein